MFPNWFGPDQYFLTMLVAFTVLAFTFGAVVGLTSKGEK
jgi:hypothetical protein